MAETCLSSCPTIRRDIEEITGRFDAAAGVGLPIVGGCSVPKLNSDCERSKQCSGPIEQKAEVPVLIPVLARLLGKPATKTVTVFRCGNPSK